MSCEALDSKVSISARRESSWAVEKEKKSPRGHNNVHKTLNMIWLGGCGWRGVGTNAPNRLGFTLFKVVQL